MAENSVFSNETGQVMFGTGGQIYKVPYEFGRAFSNKMGLRNYIEVLNCSIGSLNHSVMMYWRQTTAMNGYKYIISIKNNIKEQSYSVANITSTSDAWSLINFGNGKRYYGGLGNINGIKNYAFVKESPTNCRSWINGIKTQEFISVLDDDTEWISDRVLIGKSNDLYNNSVSLNCELLIYDRVISDAEIKFNVSNMNGSSPLSLNGVHVYLKMSKAEILDFSTLQDGSDMRVGCRDYSGFNRHGQIMNLPVGSLEDQLAYANANLFVPFIQ